MHAGNWKPFRLPWDYCKHTGYDYYAVQYVIFECIGCRLLCECKMLRDDEKRQRMELEGMFDVNFGGPGGRDLELIYFIVRPALLERVKVCIAFANTKQNFRFSRYGLIAEVYIAPNNIQY